MAIIYFKKYTLVSGYSAVSSKRDALTVGYSVGHPNVAAAVPHVRPKKSRLLFSRPNYAIYY